MLRARVREETGLTCSVGGASTKHVAKMASTISKPDGVLIGAEADTLEFLDAPPVRALWGVGPKAAEALESRGLRTRSDVQASHDRESVATGMGVSVREGLGGGRIRRKKKKKR